MTDKLFFIDDNATIGIFFQGRKDKLTIGGNSKSMHVILILIEEYFLISEFNAPKSTARNKIKFVLKITDKKYLEGISRMQKDGMIIQSTKNFNRIWW
jgi:hypothetical protein